MKFTQFLDKKLNGKSSRPKWLISIVLDKTLKDRGEAKSLNDFVDEYIKESGYISSEEVESIVRKCTEATSK